MPVVRTLLLVLLTALALRSLPRASPSLDRLSAQPVWKSLGESLPGTASVTIVTPPGPSAEAHTVVIVP
jgi:hypothetical protein